MDKAGWFWQALNQNSERMETQSSVAEVLLGGTAAIASSITVGYLVWLIKGGQVLAAIMANLPAWQLIDPLPILNSIIDDDEDEDSLHKIIIEGEREMETATL
jgi:nucleoside permease NupC